MVRLCLLLLLASALFFCECRATERRKKVPDTVGVYGVLLSRSPTPVYSICIRQTDHDGARACTHVSVSVARCMIATLENLGTKPFLEYEVLSGEKLLTCCFMRKNVNVHLSGKILHEFYLYFIMLHIGASQVSCLRTAFTVFGVQHGLLAVYSAGHSLIRCTCSRESEHSRTRHTPGSTANPSAKE